MNLMTYLDSYSASYSNWNSKKINYTIVNIPPANLNNMHHTINHLQDVTIKNSDHLKKTFNVRGNYYIFWGDTQNIFHLIVDCFGQYLHLKEQIPDLKPLTLVSEWETSSPILDELYDLFEVDTQNIAIQDYKELNFENLYFITTDPNPLLVKMFGYIGCQDMNYYPMVHNGYAINEHYTVNCLNHIRKAVDQKYTYRSENTPKKIFLDVPEMKRDILRDHVDYMPYHETYLEKGEYDRVKNLAVENGYTIINPWELTLRQQILYVKNADVILTIPSTNAFHSAWCDDNKFIFFDPHQFHFKTYGNIVKDFIRNGYYIETKTEIKDLKDSTSRKLRFEKCFEQLTKLI